MNLSKLSFTKSMSRTLRTPMIKLLINKLLVKIRIKRTIRSWKCKMGKKKSLTRIKYLL